MGSQIWSVGNNAWSIVLLTECDDSQQSRNKGTHLNFTRGHNHFIEYLKLELFIA